MTQDTGWQEVVRSLLDDPRCVWSNGVFGALAEFERDGGEATRRPDSPMAGWITERGAIAIDLAKAPYLHAYETLSVSPEHWRHGLVLALPEAQLAKGPAGLSDLGPDRGALSEKNREDRLFDLGLGRAGVSFCVRTRNPALIATLEAAAGLAPLDPANDAMAAIKCHSPARVVITPLGRIEVYQEIPSSARGGTTPSGPHTHVLPKLLASGRTHDANMALPDGLVPLFFLFPAQPALDAHRETDHFSNCDHQAFQSLLKRFGRADYVSAKLAAESAMASGSDAKLPETLARVERLAWRVALRQAALLERLAPERLAAWQALLEPSRKGESEPRDLHHS